MANDPKIGDDFVKYAHDFTRIIDYDGMNISIEDLQWGYVKQTILSMNK